MSFRNNLQHLRATRNMTQEQLAMLLGVSRQSATKWEAGKAYPEMDKLLKMCQIFECSLDDLVQGDLTSRVASSGEGGADAATDHASVPAVPAGPPTDICGYDEHQRMLARKVPAGVAIVIAAVGVSFMFDDIIFRPFDIEDGIIFAMLFFLGILASLALFIPAGMAHSAFVKAHPYIEDFYTEDEKLSARTSFARMCVAGIGLIFAGICLLMVLEPQSEPFALFVFFECVAAGVWLIVRYAMLLGRVNVAQYNKEAVDELEMEDIVNAAVDEEMRHALIRRKQHASKVGAVCGIIMLVATIAGLLMLFVWSSRVPFWMAWVAGGILCGIVSTAADAFDI